MPYGAGRVFSRCYDNEDEIRDKILGGKRYLLKQNLTKCFVW